MEHNSSKSKQLRKETKVRAGLNKKNRMFSADTDEIFEKVEIQPEKSIESEKPEIRGDRTVEKMENFLWELMS